MSLCRLALRHCAVKALAGQTIVGANVADSDFGALDLTPDGQLLTDRDRPFVLVYTDESRTTDTDLRSLRQNGELDFVIEYGVASAMTEIDPETGESVIAGVNIPATDANFEVALDLMDRQVMAILSGADGWAELWRGLIHAVTKIERRRRASADEGLRIAARQTRITVSALPDPAPGQALAQGSIWARFLAAVDGDPVEDVVRGMLGTAQPEWKSIVAGRGMTAGEAKALGFPQNATIQGYGIG
ncbi:hypothetical protein [Paracoccus sp. 22332]|uniref:hypothetical protein n=1 Tax=Paracoccus sp. 22332 TaxID=3453913 RepID=UPI003F8367DE